MAVEGVVKECKVFYDQHGAPWQEFRFTVGETECYICVPLGPFGMATVGQILAIHEIYTLCWTKKRN